MTDTILDSTWSDRVANDPKHRPQRLDRPATTVRKEWCRRPQEAHLADGNRYRRLSVTEIAVIQGFDPAWVEVNSLTENEKIAVLGNAVAPPVARAIGRVIRESGCLKTQTSIEICAGIGGLSLGFPYLEPIAKIEMWDVACAVLRHHFSESVVIEGKAQDYDFSAHQGKVGLLCGGPPCQPWSQSGARRGADDPRDVMGFTPTAIAACQPDVFLFENVPGLLSSREHSAYVTDLFERMQRPGMNLNYGVAYRVFNAADYGVPQVRRRVFILGIRDQSDAVARQILDKVEDAATHHDPAKSAYGKKPWVTLKEAFISLPNTQQWRRWNADASMHSEQIVDTGEADNLSDKKPVPIPESVARPMSISLQWPKYDERLIFTDARWIFESASRPSDRQSIVVEEFVGSLDQEPCHLAVQGDYASSLQALAPVVQNRARLVYMDAPRIDADGIFAQSTPAGYTRSAWLSLIRDVATTSIRLMPELGFFAIQTDEATSHYARCVLDEVFGGHAHHISTFACQRKYSPQADRKTPTDAFDYLTVYATLPSGNITDQIGVVTTETNLRDDGDPRGAFTAGHKGAKSGGSSLRYHINMPPYRWRLIQGTSPECELMWFDSVTGVLYIQNVKKAGRYVIKIECTDANGTATSADIEYEICPKTDKHEWSPPRDIWWLKKAGGKIPGGRLRVCDKEPAPGVVGSDYAIVLRAMGGTPFIGEKSAPKEGRYWNFTYQTLVEHIWRARADFGTKGTALPSEKKYKKRGDTTKKTPVINWLPWEIIGKSEDATRHLDRLADLGYGDPQIKSFAKSEHLVRLLIELFAPTTEHLVVSVCDNYATVASAALKMNRPFIHLVGPSENDYNVWRGKGLPRLRAVMDGADKWGICAERAPDAKKTGRSRLLESKPTIQHAVEAPVDERLSPIPAVPIATAISIGKLSRSRISVDQNGATNLYLARNESYERFVAALRGFLPRRDGSFHDAFGNACVVLPHDEMLDLLRIAELEPMIPPGRRLYVLYEQADMLDVNLINPRIVPIRVPYDI
jgi:DNA-cytosine methyltransferase